ncbi:VanZ family protein [Dermatobacter hominis]|uniref:VanZ family protein n=1 Tax=Dermatobacter hominis TaxID=2884263 RepID=UPI001D10D694|nr:VanZ family protein [Dermatobacter hominis]UDY35246.1 VanZ family protein [Dermatobacter hominis]
MGSFAASAVVAIVGGIVIALLVFVPEVAIRYRRSGRMTASDLAALVVVPVYGLAVWTYTLLPLPDPDDLVCQDPSFRPFGSFQAIRAAGVDSLADLATNWPLASAVLNVLLFVPLGVILRWRYRRGAVVAGLVGLGVSLLVETTQLTGIWGVYPCAYRYFDVDDLITNTTGALIGSLLSWFVLRHRPEPHVVPDERMMTGGQRIVAVVCDVLTILLVGTATVVAWRAIALRVLEVDADQHLGVQRALQWGVPFLVEAVVVLVLGRTIGEWAVRLGTVAPRPLWTVPGRVIKLATGPGVIVAIGWWDSPWALGALIAVAVASVVAALAWPDHRGLSNGIAGLRPVVSAWRHRRPVDLGPVELGAVHPRADDRGVDDRPPPPVR